MTFEQAKRIFAALADQQVGYALIGSMVMAVHGIFRATPNMLIRMKQATVRPQDHVDATALSEKFGREGL